ncbi:hypothetical protein N7508_006481 [Penicillium antarcticum]|uniref:uncharacterized protein n=1 Tax=Penicillium antarcticum TaxID=416450 RepID=UPI0023A4D917|nr:uncharacterized protein N7508_006481 [Penicillium antarcticum]KAJ5301618.1 hypothetical protein N7508_006481 [Penicillium antarcticum]
MIYLDHEGKLKTFESQSIERKNASVFTPEVCQNFLSILGERIDYHQRARQEIDLSRRRVRHRKRKASAEFVFEKPLDEQGSRGLFTGALKRFQQSNCSIVAKAFIKFIEPHKQAKHPYSGGKPPPGSAPGTYRDPEKSKPKWWPYTVMHREPDHLIKEERIKLLLHIIRNLGDRGITADKLKEVARETKRRLKHPSDFDIVDEILRVRKMEELLERGVVDANTAVVYIVNCDPRPTASEAVGEPLQIKQELAPISVEQAPAALTTAIESLHSTPVYSFPGSFSMPNHLKFEVGGRQNNPYYTVSPKYTNPFFHPMLGTPMTSKMASSQDTPVFKYSVQNPFIASTSVHDQTGDPGYYGPRINTDSDQEVSNRADYSSPETSQKVPPPPMKYHISTTPAHLQGTTHNYSQIPRAL